MTYSKFLPKLQSKSTALSETFKEALKGTLPTKNKRAIRLRASGLPSCSLHFLERLLTDEFETEEAMMDYYCSVGTTVHTHLQKWLGKTGKIYGDWKCNTCGHTVQNSVKYKCPKCKVMMEYVELEIEYNIFSGHIDGVLKLPNKKFIVFDYKGLALDTPIPTPTGWTTMGKIKIGDALFDSKGNICHVVEKSDIHKRKCYRITFDDASTVVCDDEHLWVTNAGYVDPGKSSVVSTDHIKNTTTGGYKHRVAIAGKLKLPEVDLPIDPYVLGCWLGDGAAANGRISKPDQELFNLISSRGYAPKANVEKRDGYCQTRNIEGLHTQLRAAGLIKNKHVPSEYLRASSKQRLLLLQGLLDTDGSWNKIRKQVVFSSTDKKLSESVKELACSLRQRAVVHEALAHGFGKEVMVYQVTFKPIYGLKPFKLSRKADLVDSGNEVRSRQRVMTRIVEIPPVKTQCLKVDSLDSTYLCTKSMIPTHNTTSSRNIYQKKFIPQAQHLLQVSAYGAVLTRQGHEVDSLSIVYVARDNPTLFAEFNIKYTKALHDHTLEFLKQQIKGFKAAVKSKETGNPEHAIKYKMCSSYNEYKEEFEVFFGYNACHLSKICFNKHATMDYFNSL